MTDLFPPGFFTRDDPSPDARFYQGTRLVTHIDDGAIAAVGAVYEHLGIDGSGGQFRRVLDLMSSWMSHFRVPPSELVVLGMNAQELAANPAATQAVMQDLNVETTLPFPDADFDAVVCCVSVDYLVRPIQILAEAARVLRLGAPIAITFSNRCFPTKAIHGWLAADEDERCAIVAAYLRLAGGFDEPQVSLWTPPDQRRGGTYRGDPLYAVIARRAEPQ